MTAKAKSSSKRKAETLQSDEGTFIAKLRKVDHRRWKRKEDYC